MRAPLCIAVLSHRLREVTAEDLPLVPRAVLLALAGRADTKFVASVARVDLAQDAGTTIATVRRALAELLEGRWITVVSPHTPRDAAVYRIHPLGPMAEGSGSPPQRDRSDPQPEGSERSTGGSERSATEIPQTDPPDPSGAPPFPTATPHHAPHAPDAHAPPRYMSPSSGSGSALGSLDRDPKTETSGRGAGETNPGPEALPLFASETPIPVSDVKPKKASRAKGVETPIPEDWTHKPAHVTLGASMNFDEARVELEAGNFADSARAKGRTYIDWDAAFRTWLRNQRRFDDDRAAKFGGAGPASKNGREVDDWARPQDSDNWPEAKLVPDLIPMPPPPPLGDPPPIPEHLKNLSAAEIERRINEAPGFHGWEPRR